MKPDLTPPTCFGCGRPAELVPKQTRSRRGDDVLPFDGFIWQCPSGCADPHDDTMPYQFSTFELMEWEEVMAAEAWMERCGEPGAGGFRSWRRGRLSAAPRGMSQRSLFGWLTRDGGVGPGSA